MKARRYMLALVIGLFMFGVGSAARVEASPPERHVLQLVQITPDGTLSTLCGFSVLRYTNVSATVGTFRDKNGNAKRAMIHQDGILEFRANGQAVEGSSQTVENVRFSENVSGTVVLEEDLTWIVWPGHGRALRGVGSLRAEFNDHGDIIMFQTTGPDLADRAICAALAP